MTVTRTKGPDGLYMESGAGPDVRIFRAARSDQPDGRRTFEAVLTRSNLNALAGPHLQPPPKAKPGDREPLVGRKLEEQMNTTRPVSEARRRNKPGADLVTDPTDLKGMSMAALRLQARKRDPEMSGRSKSELVRKITAWDKKNG